MVTVKSCGTLSIPGIALAAHGTGEFLAGVQTIMNGSHVDSVTSQILQKAVSPNIAEIVNGAISVGGTGVALRALRTAQRANFARFSLPEQPGKPYKHIRNFSEFPGNPIEGTRYSQKVIKQMQANLKTELPDFHGFPIIVDNYGHLGKVKTITGRDGITRVKVYLEGGYQGQEGLFEWIIENDKLINHRLFTPKK